MEAEEAKFSTFCGVQFFSVKFVNVPAESLLFSLTSITSIP